jgi:hypothetical protein
MLGFSRALQDIKQSSMGCVENLGLGHLSLPDHWNLVFDVFDFDLD